MFARLPDAGGEPVAVTIDGAPFEARTGDSVAAALLACGRLASRTTPVSGASRGPFCLMGVCFDCLVTIDGVPGQQGCLVTVAPGMRIDTQRGAPALPHPMSAGAPPPLPAGGSAGAPAPGAGEP